MEKFQSLNEWLNESQKQPKYGCVMMDANKISDWEDKHILVFNRSFWPDIEATGQLLTELCEELAKKYKITAIVGRSHYMKEDFFAPGRFYSREMYKGIEILRVRHTRFWKGRFLGRFTNWLTYSILAFIVALRVKPHFIINCTDPPFLGIMPSHCGRGP